MFINYWKLYFLSMVLVSFLIKMFSKLDFDLKKQRSYFI